MTEHLQYKLNLSCTLLCTEYPTKECLSSVAADPRPPVAAGGRQWKMANWFDSRGPAPPPGGGAAPNYQLLKIRFAVHYFRIQKPLPFSRPKIRTGFLTQLSGPQDQICSFWYFRKPVQFPQSSRSERFGFDETFHKIFAAKLGSWLQH